MFRCQQFGTVGRNDFSPRFRSAATRAAKRRTLRHQTPETVLVLGGRLDDVLHKIMGKYIGPCPTHQSSRYAPSLAKIRFPSDDSLIEILDVERDLHCHQRRTRPPRPEEVCIAAP